MLAEPWGSVSAGDYWMPKGFDQVEEAQLHQAPRLLRPQDCEVLGDWWLAEPSDDSRTPNWDIVTTCTVDQHKGLLLVEAKAHTQELKAKDRVKGSRLNCEGIAKCIEGANVGLEKQTGLGWALSHKHCYQISNRFAWSWKLTELGYPVILVYLGFLGATEMRKGKEQNPFNSHAEWEDLVKAHSEPLFPQKVWNRQWEIHGQPFVPRICSINIGHDAPMEEE